MKDEGFVSGLFVCRADVKVLSEPVDELWCDLEGVRGDRHFGFTRRADVRDKPIPKYIDGERHLVRNWRQWSAVAAEEMNVVADALGLDTIDPRLVGANMCFSGIPHFSRLSKGTTLWFDGGVILTVEGYNEPCIHPGNAIAVAYGGKIEPRDFVIHASELRGLVGVVYKPGRIKVGEKVIAYHVK